MDMFDKHSIGNNGPKSQKSKTKTVQNTDYVNRKFSKPQALKSVTSSNDIGIYRQPGMRNN